MADFSIGKGVYIWQPEVMEDGQPDRILARLQMAGVQSVALKLADGCKIFDKLQPLIQLLRDNNIRVAGWGYSYLDRVPAQEAQTAAQACKLYQPDFFLIDVEAEVERNYTGAQVFINTLRPALANLPLGLNTFWSANYHPLFPWAAFLNQVDFVCPQVYWRGFDPVGKLKQSQQEYANVPNARHVPMPMVAGDMFVQLGVEPAPGQVTQFLSAADADPTLHGVFMWAADDSQTTPELWQEFSRYQWQSGGTPLPRQPVGWAKITARGGLYIRATPGGHKLGALAKDELTPIWTLQDGQWAAINAAQTQWIFTGNPNYLRIVMDTSNVPPPPPGVYAGWVIPAQGLNVRNGIWGKILRAVPVKTVLQVYEEKDGWGRVNPTQSEWVCVKYLSKIQ